MVKETLASLGNKSLRSNSSDDKVAGRDVRPQSRVMIADVELSSPLSRMSKANKLKITLSSQLSTIDHGCGLSAITDQFRRITKSIHQYSIPSIST